MAGGDDIALVLNHARGCAAPPLRIVILPQHCRTSPIIEAMPVVV
jgi:hypothetical protein